MFKKIVANLIILLITGYLFADYEIDVGSLIVNIQSKKEQRLPGAQVQVKYIGSSKTRTQMTGPYGKTTFRNLKPGYYIVYVRMDKFLDSQNIVYISAAKTSRVLFVLELLPKEFEYYP
ncbi:MAG: carboxypeptidase regulatory-like domain-containing protein [Acidobacteria bacterium]|nr:carboxypeptidase regulatory-like domain-containing protein [Acidobacteriota bacterium]